MESEFRGLLLGDSAFAALVPALQCAWNHVPQTAADPFVSLYVISSITGVHMGGSDRLTNSLVQINVRALSVTSMWAVRNAIVAKLHCHKSTVGNIVFQGIFKTAERQNSEKPGTVLYHTAQIDFDVWSGLVS